MSEELPPKFRGIKKREFYEVIVAEGQGFLEDPVREVHYFLDEKGKIKFIEDPCKKALNDSQKSQSRIKTTDSSVTNAVKLEYSGSDTKEDLGDEK